MAAESQSVLVAAIIPIFVAALAIASFMNGFWMVRIPKFTSPFKFDRRFNPVRARIFYKGNVSASLLVFLGTLDRKPATDATFLQV
jgi:hypothetical protein